MMEYDDHALIDLFAKSLNHKAQFSTKELMERHKEWKAARGLNLR